MCKSRTTPRDWFKCTRPEHPAHGGVMLCTVQCRPASACARKSPPRGCTLKKQDKTRQDMTTVLGRVVGGDTDTGRATQTPQHVDMVQRELVPVLVPLEVGRAQSRRAFVSEEAAEPERSGVSRDRQQREHVCVGKVFVCHARVFFFLFVFWQALFHTTTSVWTHRGGEDAYFVFLGILVFFNSTLCLLSLLQMEKCAKPRGMHN